MVQFQPNYDCPLRNTMWSMMAFEVDPNTLVKIREEIQNCVAERGLTNEQLGSEFFATLKDVDRYNRGED